MTTKRKQNNLKRFFDEIDNVYVSYKMKNKRCEAELYRVQDVIEEQLKEGQIDENVFQLLNSRINKYLDEIKQTDR